MDMGLVQDGLNREIFICHIDIRHKWQTLSARERDISILMLDGFTNKGIAERLNILPDTAKKHRANVLQKMQTTTLAELVAVCRGVDVQALS
jgi:FixJ family two-component response regulator